jgi:predicted acyltransferase
MVDNARVPPPSPPRLTSVDVFRGATMAAMVIVNNPGDWGHVYAPLLHAEWHGWTPTDLIFPFFVFIVGVSITLSGRSRASVPVIVRRALLLFLIGLGLALYPRFSVATVRIMGVLPRLALCYLGAALIYRAVDHRSAGPARPLLHSLAWAGALLVGYWVLLTWVPVPGGVAGNLTPGNDLGAWLDRLILGEQHLWRQSKTWDPEGLLSTLPALATALTGVAAGTVLRAPQHVRVPQLLIAGLVAMAGGLVWDLWFPINKNLWTSSYVLFTSGMAAVLLGGLHWVIDIGGHRRFTRPLVVLGVNALTLFVVSALLVKTMALISVTGEGGTRMALSRWLFLNAFAPAASPKTASLLYALANLAVLYALLEWLYRRRWWLRV